ncbi:hypothetical protein [Companilactobacillus kimchiensis]|uniref:Uncharacterized protein n=1 Tax=Companilactobacillus kimchiensis TaxID=993692 RepID=A0A0R2LMQ4_9LACO|nr:hypothetical protein [Companilactobacillus kimchiensis]KRO00317.1 hypothetical protein IV57_GL001420 [Companilactobacillus kimchiensis]
MAGGIEKMILTEAGYKKIIERITNPVSNSRKEQLKKSAKRIDEKAPFIDTGNMFK